MLWLGRHQRTEEDERWDGTLPLLLISQIAQFHADPSGLWKICPFQVLLLALRLIRLRYNTHTHKQFFLCSASCVLCFFVPSSTQGDTRPQPPSFRFVKLLSREETNPLGFIYIPPAHILPARLGSTTRHSSSLVVCFFAITHLPPLRRRLARLTASCGQCHRPEHLPRLLHHAWQRYRRHRGPRNATLVTPRPRLGPHSADRPAFWQKRRSPHAKKPKLTPTMDARSPA